MDSSGSWGSLKAAYAQLAGVAALPAVGAPCRHWLTSCAKDVESLSVWSMLALPSFVGDLGAGPSQLLWCLCDMGVRGSWRACKRHLLSGTCVAQGRPGQQRPGGAQVRQLALVLLAFRLGVLPAEQAAPLKLLEKGVSKEALAGLVRLFFFGSPAVSAARCAAA